MESLTAVRPDTAAWTVQPRAAQAYVAAVTLAGAACFAGLLPSDFSQPWLFAALLAASCLTSTWKVNLPIPLACGSTLSVSYAADLMALLLLGPRHATFIAVIGAWFQCKVHVVRPYPLYRALFSAAAEAITMATTGYAYVALGGRLDGLDALALAKPLVGAIVTYFVVNTGLVATAIALTTDRTPWAVWRDEFQWSGVSFLVAGTVGALAAIAVRRGDSWIAVLLLAPVYLTYRSYHLFVGRLDDQRRHTAEVERLHHEAMTALTHARAAERALSEANRVKDQFLAIVSHELRTPLNAIFGWADLLQRGHVDPSRLTRAHRAIYEGARRQLQLIEDLLDVSRIVSGKLRLTRAPVVVDEVIRAALEVVQSAADAKRIRLMTSVDPSAGTIQADGARLQQIIWNLLANAIKFTPDDGTVRVSARRDGRAIEISVSDTGEGIAPEFLKLIFEPFRQADASATRVHGGLGLGLAIVRHLVEAHGGTIRAESAGEGQGATFIVRLPALQAEPIAPPAVGNAAKKGMSRTAASMLRGLRVLVVDDDEASRELLAAYLETEGADVLSAASASDAFELLQGEHVDIMLVDIAMPGEDGCSLLGRVRALGEPAASIPAIAVTAFARTEDRRQTEQAGFRLHLTKPVDRQMLVDAVLGTSHPPLSTAWLS